MTKKSYTCNYCQRPTKIRRGYSLALMIAWIVLFIPAAPIYYFMCKRQCQACGGTDISELPEVAPAPPDPEPRDDNADNADNAGGAPVKPQ